MAQQFLHGVETVNLTKGPRPITEVKTAVIGLVGISPIGPKNKITLVKNDVDAAQFGEVLPGFDIPQALNIIFGFHAGTVIVVNVFDDVAHTTNVVKESQPVTNGKLKLAFAPIGAVTLFNVDGVTPSAYIKGTDYTLDEFGNFKVIAGRIADATVIKFDYKKLNAGSVLSANIIGAVGGDGNRTGIKAWDLAFTQFGFRPKILIAPGRSNTKAIADELLASAIRLKAVPIIDGVFGEDVATTITNRGNAAKSFGLANKRPILTYPYLKGYDKSKDDGGAATDTNTDYPYSMFLAGLMAWNDRENGYWWSPSNKEFKGVTGVERPISANLNDASTDANALNEAGIMTVFNSFGSGYRAWGNRNASWPTNTEPDNFISLLRTFDVVDESLEQAALAFIDRPINNAVITDILQSGNEFIGILVGRGALTPGSKIVFDKAENPVTQMSAGQLVFTIIKDGPSPLERLTYKSIIDISLKGKN